MILELVQSPLARRLALVNEQIVALLKRIADAPEGADFVEVKGDWPFSGPNEEAVEAVLKLPAAARRELHQRVAADLGFEASLGGEDFRFTFADLDPDTREAGGALLRSMYTTFGGPGFELAPGDSISRATWEAAFRDANPEVRVCPACLANQMEEPVDGRTTVDADHYLPKERYPALSVHGLNLVPICPPCNKAAKGRFDPLHGAAGPRGLDSIWFPYRRPGLHEAALRFELRDEFERVVKLEGRAACEQRAERFDEIFKVSSRWSASLEDIHRRIVRSLALRCDAIDAPAIRTELRILGREKAESVSTEAQALLVSRYCQWLIQSGEALAALVEEAKEAAAARSAGG